MVCAKLKIVILLYRCHTLFSLLLQRIFWCIKVTSPCWWLLLFRASGAKVKRGVAWCLGCWTCNLEFLASSLPLWPFSFRGFIRRDTDVGRASTCVWSHIATLWWLWKMLFLRCYTYCSDHFRSLFLAFFYVEKKHKNLEATLSPWSTYYPWNSWKKSPTKYGSIVFPKFWAFLIGHIPE